jgi:outer membrane receptor for ferrienterochelin and colicins
LWTHDAANDRVLPGRAKHAGTAGLRLARRRWGTSLRVRSSIFGARTFFADTDGDAREEVQSSPAFATLDLRLAQQVIANHGEVFVGVDNVLDAGDATNNPIPPRAFFGGVTVRY